MHESNYYLKYIVFTDRCWIWTGSINDNGYAIRTVKKRQYRVHRLIYEFINKVKIPDDLVLDHKCRVRCCVNPDCMQIITRGKNVQIGLAGKYQTLRTHCPKNHEYTPENTRKYQGKRFCRKCNNERKHK